MKRNVDVKMILKKPVALCDGLFSVLALLFSINHVILILTGDIVCAFSCAVKTII